MVLNIELSKVTECLKKRVMTTSTIKILVILESTENVDSYLEMKNALLHMDFLCIATTPEVCGILDNKNQKYATVDGYLSIDDINEIGLLNFQKVEKYCEIIDNRICRDYPTFKKYSLKAASDNYQFFKILFDEIAFKITTLENIIREESPTLILSFYKRDSIHSSSFIPFQYNEHVFNLLLKQEGWPCDHISIGDNFPTTLTRTKKEYKSLLFPVLKKIIRLYIPLLYSALSIGQHFGLKQLLYCIGTTLKNILKFKKTACIVGFGYDWDLIISELVKNQYNIAYIDIEKYPQKSQLIEGINFPKDQIRKLCSIGSIDTTDFIIENSIPQIADAIALAAEYSQKIDKFILKHKPSVLLCSTKSNFSDHIAAHIAKVNNIPIVSWQHGASGFFSYYPILEYSEISGSDIHLVWGGGVKQQIEHEFPPKDCRIVTSGSYALQEVFLNSNNKKNNENKNKILYITTNYFHNSLYIGYSHKVQDINFWITQKIIIDALGSFNIPAIFKIHPSTTQPQHFHGYIQWKKFKQLAIIKDEKSLSSLIDDSEIIIIDFPSTTLLQAIASQKIVFVLLKYAILTQEANALLRKRAYCYENATEMAGAIRKYLNHEDLDQIPDPNNTEFLEQYGVYKTDGDVATRAIEALDEIISGTNQ